VKATHSEKTQHSPPPSFPMVYNIDIHARIKCRGGMSSATDFLTVLKLADGRSKDAHNGCFFDILCNLGYSSPLYVS